MARRSLRARVVALVVVALALAGVPPAAGAVTTGTGFVYQGSLMSAGSSVNGSCAMGFSLWDAPVGGLQVGRTQLEPAVAVTNGLFTVVVNPAGEFGPQAFKGDARWLAMAVRCASETAFTDILPRQELAPIPYAQYSVQAGSLQGFPLSTAPPANGQVLKFGGTQWAPGTDNTISRPGFASTALPTVRARDPAVAIGVDGLPLIAWVDDDTGALQLGHCKELACTAASVVTVEPSGVDHVSIGIGGDGLPLIAYQKTVTLGSTIVVLKLAKCADSTCTAASSQTVTGGGFGGDPGNGTQVVLGADGRAFVVHYDEGAGKVEAYRCDDVTCSSLTLTGSKSASSRPSAVVAPDGALLVAHLSSAGDELQLSRQPYRTAAFTSTATVASTLATPFVVEIGVDGNALIAYRSMPTFSSFPSLRVAHCSSSSCGSAPTVSSLGSNGLPLAFVVGGDGMGVAFFGDTGLDVAHCSNTACTDHALASLDESSQIGDVAAAVGADGLPFVAYVDATGGLRAVKCSNRFCTPYVRYR